MGDDHDPSDPRYRYIGLVVAVVVVIASLSYHVVWWDELGG